MRSLYIWRDTRAYGLVRTYAETHTYTERNTRKQAQARKAAAVERPTDTHSETAIYTRVDNKTRTTIQQQNIRAEHTHTAHTHNT